MSAEKVLTINRAEFTVYVQLLDEGTVVYRPVSAVKEQDGVCVIAGIEIFDREIETWEFEPGSRVTYELRKFDGEVLPVATSLASSP
ncbi:MAG: hypothetical protein ABIP64_06520 [Burkholderiales bacterium]